MRLGGSASVSKTRDNQRVVNSRTRKKHKKLDAICEKTYNRNHSSIEAEPSECNVGGGDELELRRGTRVRRAPEVLDASPPPVKKRRRVDKIGNDSIERVKRRDVMQIGSPCSTSRVAEEESDGWRSRLRSRAKNASFGVREKGNSSTRGRRKLFEDLDGFKEESKLEIEECDKEERLKSGKSTVVKSKRPGRVKASNKEVVSSGGKEDGREKNGAVLENNDNEVVENDDNENHLQFNGGVGYGSEEGVEDGTDSDLHMVGNEEGVEVGTGLELEDSIANENVNALEQDVQMNLPESVAEIGSQRDTLDQDMHMNLPESVEERGSQRDTLEQDMQMNLPESVEEMDTLEQAMQMKLPESVEERENQMDAIEIDKVPTDQAEVGGSHDKPVEDKNAMNVDKSNCASTGTLGKPRIKEGRRCGLCGGGTADGKPPKKLVHDGAGSDNEAYSGSSTSDESNYDIWDGFGDEPGWLGRLLGPINDRFGIARIWVHQHCAVWSPEVYFAGLGCLKNVRAALCRGRVLKCTRCRRPGATIGCRVDRCPKTYHLPCARANGCVFDHRKFLIACTDHRHIFQPHGSKFFSRIKKMKAKKMKFEMRKLSSDAWRKDHEAEEKWLENCGEDEEFLRRENKRLHRDLLRIAPVYIGGSNPESEINYQGWESVAGLQHVIQCMKEVVILPLLYPEFFGNLGLTPPRGVLLHGYPGTGKTLVVRALIGSCARGDKRIAYFARKGADCLGKYVGDAERQLRLLFQVAEKSQPSIIFFDEIDGLAPSRTRQQDQTHSSVVSTLLALLDGLKSRGSVVVIGATNRPDAVDPALRRPGRFDREIYFPLPSIHDRAAILTLHTKKWPKPVSGSLLNWVARRTVGFAGADLQALCTQTAIIALRRNCPFQELLSAAGEKASHGMRPPLPTFTVEERDWLEAISCAPPPCSRREAGMAANDVISSPLHMHLSPCLVRPLSILVISLFLDERLWLPPSLSIAATQIKSVIVSALDKKKVQSDRWWTHVHNLLQEVDVMREIENSLSRARILIGEATYPNYGGLDVDSDDDSTQYEKSKLRQISARPSLRRSISSTSSEKKSRFRILIAGSSRAGQKYLGSCLLHCFVGNVEIRKIDLATISQEGLGDLVQGVTRLLMRCASESSCLIFMPRIDLWAIETCHQIGKQESDSSSTDLELSEENDSCLTHGGNVEKQNESCPLECESASKAEPHDVTHRSAYIWSSFVEQVESMRVSTSLMILATSEVPFPLLPLCVRQFFQSDLLNCSLSTPLVDNVPRFPVEVDGNFNRDMVISSSAAELSKDLAQQFIQFIHPKVHTHTSSWYREEASDTDPGSAIEHEKSTLRPFSSVMSVPVPTLKGKSNLLLAISTMGYQILRYPHFAELCWVTSKLKNGPSSDINGPWKGWPFNTCIIRPNNSLEKVAIACNSSNINGKENPGLVRGLIAVGLSAYRGVYKSLREVSSEVRKVLELLAGEINAKVQAGKDRYQFVRILSQVAYLEDMVNCWAYTLQSLEVDPQTTVADPKLASPQMTVADPKPASCESPNNNNTSNNLLQTDGCKLDVSSKSFHKSEMLEEGPQIFVSNHVECVDLAKGDGDSRFPNPEGRVADIGPPHQIPLDHSALDIHSQSSARAANPLGGKLLNEKSGNDPELYSSKHLGNYTRADRSVGSFKHSNGFAGTDSVILMEDGTCDSGRSHGVKLPSSGKDCSSREETGIPFEDSNPNSDKHNVDLNFSSTTSGLSSGSGVVCFYRCCSECLFNLHRLMQEILNSKWGLKANDLTVEDVHDLVSSLSVNLHSAVRKFFVSDDIGKMSETQEMGICCKTSGNSFITPMNPMECTCHSRSENVTSSIANLSLDSQRGLDLKFIYRNGVLASLDTEKDVSFHCKFETLCLCSLIEWIVVTKQP